MADQQYLPTGYTKCDLTAKGKGPAFNIQNQRAWKNPTPTPWGKELVGTPYQQGAGSLGMSMDNSGVVGKFRSFYSTIEQVKQAFLQYDINRDGNISRKELEDGMSGSGQFSLEDARITFDKADINGDGEIDLAEFCPADVPQRCRNHFQHEEPLPQHGRCGQHIQLMGHQQGCVYFLLRTLKCCLTWWTEAF
jgi:hypothetical protein